MNKNNEKNYLTVEETAEFCKVPKSTIYFLAHKRQIPHYKRGKRLLFDKDNIINWIEQSKVSTKEELRERINRG